MAASGVAFSAIGWSVLLLGGVGLPLGTPPLPPDPLRSWFGDNLLTAICTLALTQADVRQTAWHGAATWLSESATRGGQSVAVVSNLNTWHTALALDLLVAVGSDSEVLDTAIEWLMRQFIEGEDADGWSWSSDATMICMDTTSMIAGTMASIHPRDLEIQRKVALALAALRAAQTERNMDFFKMPTFVYSGRGLHPCPVISARCIPLLDLCSRDRRCSAQSVAKRVADENWNAEWFASREMTEGLVLWHLSPYLKDDDRAGQRLVVDLIEAAKCGRITSSEGISTSIIGLLAAQRLASRESRVSTVIEQLVDELLSRDEGGTWKGAPVGQFGFDRLYADDHLATVLALRALREYLAGFEVDAD
jgi:hypothetical protein